jgi:hypothetical protein
MTERETQKGQVRPAPASGQDPDAHSPSTGRRPSPITYRVELVSVSGEEGKALFKGQQDAVLNALRWAPANASASENVAGSDVVEQSGSADTVASGTIIAMESRSLTMRERAVLEALLAVDFAGADNLRRQIANVVVVARCDCGCPSIDFQHHQGSGMSVRVNAGIPKSHDGLFLYTVADPDQGEVLGDIEWAGVVETNPDEFPRPSCWMSNLLGSVSQVIGSSGPCDAHDGLPATGAYRTRTAARPRSERRPTAPSRRREPTRRRAYRQPGPCSQIAAQDPRRPDRRRGRRSRRHR